MRGDLTVLGHSCVCFQCVDRKLLHQDCIRTASSCSQLLIGSSLEAHSPDVPIYHNHMLLPQSQTLSVRRLRDFVLF